MPNMYIIAGCNGAGKTTASMTVLPEVFNCKEFVNADNIAYGLSPLNPESASIQAGKLMLDRINRLLFSNLEFAFETTLATKSFAGLIQKCYNVTLAFFWLETIDLAIERVKNRVVKGGHNIPEDVIRRRYSRGINNFFTIYQPIVDRAIVINCYKQFLFAA